MTNLPQFFPRRLAAWLFLGLLAVVVARAEITAGMTEAEVIAVLGKPLSRMKVGDTSICRWPTMDVTLRRGLVFAVRPRDLAAEQREEARRQRVAEEERAKEAAWRAAHPPTPSTPTPMPGLVMPKTPVQIAAERAARAQRILSLTQSIANQRSILDQYSRRFSNPNTGAISSAQRDVAQALIAQYEAEIEEIERQQ